MKITAITLLCFSLYLTSAAQESIFFWTDTSTTFFNHRIIALTSDGSNIYTLSKSHDENYKNVRPSFSRLNLKGKLEHFTIYPKVNELYELNALVQLPNKNFRIYGSTIDNSNKISPYINEVTPQGEIFSNMTAMVNVSHLTGDAILVGQNSCIWGKAIRGSSTNLFNAFVYRVDLSRNDQQLWRCPLKSDFNEEVNKLVLLPDTSLLVLCKRYIDETFLSYTAVVYKIDNAGTLLWSKELNNITDFTTHSLASNGKDIFYINNTGSESTAINNSNVVVLNMQGDLMKRQSYDKINATGGMVLQNGNLLLFGGCYLFSGNVLTKKAKVVVLDKTLKLVAERQMNVMDAPDGNLPGMAASFQPTGSDFLCGMQLPDKRVVLGGRVFMPLRYSNTSEMMISPRANSNMLVFCTESGNW